MFTGSEHLTLLGWVDEIHQIGIFLFEIHSAL